MGNAAAAVQRDAARPADTDAAVAALFSERAQGAGTRMIFLDGVTAEGLLAAVVAWPAPPPRLSDICTLFEHFGLAVQRQRELDHPDADALAIHLFEFATVQQCHHSGLVAVAEAVAAHADDGFMIDDFAGLILAAEITWRQVGLIRSGARLLRQAGLGLSQQYVIATLKNHPLFVTAFLSYFTARFDPGVDGRDAAMAAAGAELTARIDSAVTLDEDRILRAFASFVTAMLRTNWFQRTDNGVPKAHSSFMFDSAQLYPRGQIVPFREIFVDANDIEGIHLRAGHVARGGLRFSDRPEDYRTEVLSLMKTQAVKNSVIVPVGAKGAFIRRNSAISADEAYCTFIDGILDVIDNRVDGCLVPPPNSVTYGGEDSYLVVAADKGTARFSDLANQIATGRRYWLGDAFASGGSAGYDHKQMGITARGAWVSVRALLAERGIDIAAQPVRVAGIGDMSGDVFGNGMLLSDQIRLVAAFDHRHIFLDPDPDAAASYAERQRLFGRPRSSWDDYDRSCLSAGGGVWPRTAKRIELAPQARDLLGLTQASITPDELIRAVLASDVDLLWNGGIGTYVKATLESHTDAADPANDAVRIDANQLRASVIGEGGNLGLTQRARVEYALNGGRINADFIDNAAGVATSDREVNLKIALDSAQHRGCITAADRSRLLDDAREDVSEAVLGNCDDQVLAIGLAEFQAPQLLNRHERLMRTFEHSSGIDRRAEGLPSRGELVSRTRAGRGLTRPEIAVLLAHSKNVVRDELLASGITADPVFAHALRSYFPASFSDTVAAEIDSHCLAHEIIATQIAGDLIDHVGPGLIYLLEERLGVKSPSVVAAYAVIRDLFDIDREWQTARAELVAASEQKWSALLDVQQVIERAATRLLRLHGGRLDVAATIERYREPVRALRARIDAECPANWQWLRTQAFDLSRTARDLQQDIGRVADTYLAVDDALGLTWIVEGLDAHIPSTWWDAMAAGAVRDDLDDIHHRLTAAALVLAGKHREAPAAVWANALGAAVERFTEMRAELGRDGLVDVARAATVNAELALVCRQTESLAAHA